MPRTTKGSTPEAEAAASGSELAAEQSYVDHAYECLARMRGDTARALGSDVVANPAARRALKKVLEHRLQDLDQDQALAFGRTDAVDGETFYIGRRHVHDELLDPVVLDWRSPVATAFYQASVEDPWELERRRSFLTEGQRLLDLHDEVFVGPRARSVESAAPLIRAGDVLLAELARERTLPMRDIAATIQREQDRLIRLEV